MKILTIICFILVSSISCIYEPTSTTNSYIENKTNHTIEIFPFINGIVDTAAYKKIEPNETLLVYSYYERLKIVGNNYGNILENYDSVIIKFDSLKLKFHKCKNDSLVHFNDYEWDNPRNITNFNNYIKVVEEKKHSMYSTFTYTFTEQDYIDAQ